MKFLLPITCAFLLILSACGPNKVQEGEIEYTITYPHSNVTGFVQAILPEKMVLTFKGTKIKSKIKRGKIFMTEVISDESDQSIEMRLDFGNDDFYSDLNPEEVKELIASQPKYKVTKTNKSDSLMGLFGFEYSVLNPNDTIIHTNSWFCEDLAPINAYWYSSYKDIKGVPLVFDIERYGIIMHMEISNFVPREVKDEEFQRAPELKKVSYKEYEGKVQELFDILLDE